MEVAGATYRVNANIPGVYEKTWDEGCFIYCNRCTEASRPGSTRDECLGAQQVPPIDFILVKAGDFIPEQ